MLRNVGRNRIGMPVTITPEQRSQSDRNRGRNRPEYAPGIKIAIEYGWIDISTIWSSYLGEQKLLAGTCINYANRISSAGMGNRCLIGPRAMEEGMNKWRCEGPFTIAGKTDEGDYTYWQLGLGDIWREGFIEPGEDKYWG